MADQNLSRPMICIPKEHMFYIQSPPSPPEITIELSRVQVIEIDVKLNQLTASMEFRVNWTENGRYDLATPVKEWIIIKEKAIHQQIWSPGIDIRKNLVTLKTKEHKLQFAKDSNDEEITWLAMSYNIFTRVKCNMNDSTFPFDEQECTIEVSSTTIM